MIVSVPPVLALSPLGLAWILTRKRRILPLTREIILSRIHKGELDRLKDFMPHNNMVDILKTDARFYECIGGFEGLLRERDNAVCCVQLCQLYVLESRMDRVDVEYVSRRSFAIGFLILASLPEQFIRLFWRSMPHFCARWISYLYWEAATQTRMLNLEYGTGQLIL
jgi:hypothetical protein